MENDNLYPECEWCQNLGNCPHPDVAQDMMGTPLCPDNCPKPNQIMKATLKKKKQRIKKN